MHEVEIAPLARRLAEENNVDWRRLTGSGDGGRIVERDVLSYLARVMAGDEAVDPTPEPVPDGMQAWPEEDVAARTHSHDDASTATPTLDDELFLFEDVVAPPSAPPAATAATAVDRPRVDDVEDDAVWLVGDDPAPSAAGAAEPGPDEGLQLGDLPDLTAADDDLFEADASERGHGPGTSGTLDLPDLFAEDAPAPVGTPAADVLFAEEPDGVAGEGGVEAATSDRDLVVTARGVVEDAPTAATYAPDPVAPADRPGEAAVPVGRRDAGSAPLVRHGQVWRRRLDDRALRRAASEAAAALDVPPTAVVSLLLARAVLRAGVTDGPIQAWRWRGTGEARRTTDWEEPVRSAVHGLEGAFQDDARDGRAATLVVADLSDIDVDEAVLHLGVPVLALGRSAGDGAWLTFAGDDLDGSAAGSLASVAALLATPVRLLV